MTNDTLTDSFASLRLSSSMRPSQALRGFSAWRHPPITEDTHPSLTQEHIKKLLSERLSLDANPANFPRLNKRPRDTVVQTHRDVLPPEPKPSILIMLLHEYKRIKQENPAYSAESIMEEFDASFDVIIPRNVLLKIMTNSEWSVFAVRITSSGPLFIDRTESYSSNPGSAGHMFEQVISISPPNCPTPPFHRIYAISSVAFSPRLRTLLSGEVDCVDESLTPVEVTTKPSWVPSDATRLLSTYIQSLLIGVQTIVTGGFDTVPPRGSGKLVFGANKVQFESAEKVRMNLDKDAVEACFEVGQTVLEHVKSACKQLGVVYKISGVGAAQFRCSELDSSEVIVSEKTMLACAEAICSM
ncbi:hypothetical protein BCR33DRAFT_848727 [Rhizoclosmatium globosum]|uniref:Decapping nuclease n=1 Tax=Rhizoclosmatium globosum TaxID=329046 RepID=A0A1Y2CK40_9FUNG|nr:hypothetical protein BCR33DRAFT_848727 [Rhizoclosmatium globosum]|eukprot:ORY47379.1 hypothetical protein BCR33DRAFT_848727 [Rhizoclosmatium globosum]